MIPSRDRAIEILKENTDSSFEGILKHSLQVEKLAEHIALQIDCNLDTVIAGSLLHDIGRFKHPPKSENAICHGVEGAKILTALGIDHSIIKIAETHIGAGITEDDVEIQKLPLEKRDYTPLSIEEKIVGYADNCVRYDEILDVYYPIERFKKSLGVMHANRVISIHNELHEKGYVKDINGYKVTTIGKIND